ncbi:hypothetical protein HHB55_11080, partial [Neisseria meningitidis]|uniref:hypothetical protein n=1 Tax=Neisseria meningitidis TaxID=487 RepID=UPI001C5AA668
MAMLLLATLFASSLAADFSIIANGKSHVVPRRSEAERRAMFEAWLVKHRKNYNALGEKERRFEIFKDNLRFIDEHNAEEERSYRVGLNLFADLTNE